LFYWVGGVVGLLAVLLFLKFIYERFSVSFVILNKLTKAESDRVQTWNTLIKWTIGGGLIVGVIASLAAARIDKFFL
jgi:hypothetical protein